MAKNLEKLIFGGLHEKHAVQHGIWVSTQHSLRDQGKPRSNRFVRTSQETHYVSATKRNRLLLHGETEIRSVVQHVVWYI
jgi:hypothetical protein